jgi:osmotically-inducible protein OsmY
MFLDSCRTPAGRTAGEMVDDAGITSRIKTRLLAEDVLQGLAIDVDTFEGVVTLTGAVKTEEQKQRAEEITKNFSGVKKVNNLLVVRK